MTDTRPLSARRFPLLTVFGLGHLPMSGTFGSIPPVVVAGLAIAMGLHPATHPVLYNALILAMLVGASVACVVQGDLAEIRFRRKDPKEVVADEVAGQSVALLALPVAVGTSGWTIGALLVASFLAFRAFDIAKFWPMSRLERLPGGWGVLLDDIAAGVFAWITIQVAAAVLL
ncbi:MAG: phosphatidylglycerophosphatase A [Phycisphaerales bacterium]|nr:MAG: phosphatidylglycerophosphatase A [Phycisphaerales bacterium]